MPACACGCCTTIPNATIEERRASVGRMKALVDAVLAGDAGAGDRAMEQMILANSQSSPARWSPASARKCGSSALRRGSQRYDAHCPAS